MCSQFALTPEQLMSLPPQLRLRLLNFLVRWRQFEEALPTATRLAEDRPAGLLYQSNLVKVLAALGRFDEAAAILAELDYRHHGRPNVLAAAGDLEMARGDLPAALKHYLGMLKRNPNSTKALRRLAALYLAAGQVNKAHAACRKAIEAGGHGEPHPGLLRVLADVHRAHGDHALASEIDAQLAASQREEQERLRADISRFLGRTQGSPLRGGGAPAEPVHAGARELPPDARRCLKEVFGHEEFRVGQEEAIARPLGGQDLLVVMPAGAGKSLCYQLPAALGRRVVVISPLIALMKDQVDGLPRELAPRATLVNSMLESDEVERRLHQISAGRFDLIYAAPERLRNTPFLHALRRAGVDLFVVDEVHCVNMWGHDFRPDYLFIAPALKMLGNPTFCGMTATAGPPVRNEIEAGVGRSLVTVSAGTYRPNLVLEARRMSRKREKLRALARICSFTPGSGIVYAYSRKQTEEIAEHLRSSGIDAVYYHAGMEPDDRAAAQESFMRGDCRVMVATVAFGMGIDKSDVRFVVHFSPPQSIEHYYQEAGRAGRDGLTSRCILFHTPGDRARLNRWAASQQADMGCLRAVYESIKRLVPDGAGTVHDDDIQRESGCDEVSIRVAISLLERVGLLARRLDVPVSATMRLKSVGEREDGFAEFVSSARLREGQTISLDLADLASRTDLPLHELEPLLLEWRDKGHIAYRSSGRTMYIEMRRPPRRAREDLREMLNVHRAEAVRRVEMLASYAESARCRHDFISRYFGEPPVTGCQSCDNCISASAPASLREEHVTVLQGVASLPIRLGRTGLVKALTGAAASPIRRHEWPYLGVFSDRTQAAVKEMIQDLLDWGYLEQDGSLLRPLLVLTKAGRRLLVDRTEQG